MNSENRPALTREELLRKIQEVGFLMVECELYLDGYPECKSALDYYKELSEKYKNLLAEYEGEYAPIRHENIIGEKWSWVDTPWPWQTGERK